MLQDATGNPVGPGPQPGLQWSIKLQFLSYIARMPDGQCSVTNGAEVADDDAFFFSPGEGSVFDAATATGVLKFRGDVRFGGHYGFLFIRIADPWLTIDHGAATLSIVAPPGESPARIPIVMLDFRPAGPPDGAGRYRGYNVRLTAEGSELFNSAYPVGEQFDDLTVLHPSASPEGMP